MGGGGCGWVVVFMDGQWWLQMGQMPVKKKQNKREREREERTYWWILNADGCGRRWMWTWTDVDADGCGRRWSEHGGTVDDSARLQVCLDLEIFVQVYTAMIYY